MQFTYDYLGRRVNKLSTGWDSSTQAFDVAWHHHYFYQGFRPIYDWTDNGANGAWTTKTYVWGNDLSGGLDGAGGVGGLLWMNAKVAAATTTNTSYASAYDGNGNVRALVQANAAAPGSSGMVERYAYDGFGRELAGSTQIQGSVNDFRFSTKEKDVETGMNYYGLRYHDSNNGRWINRDPSLEEGGYNVYAQCGNDAVDAFDVNGLWKRKSPNDTVWIAESGDTLKDLASKIENGSDPNNWSALWPVNGTQDHGYPDTIQACDQYDASNLDWFATNRQTLMLLVAPDLPQYLSIFPGMTQEAGSMVNWKIKEASNEGATPINKFVLAGHGGYSNHNGDSAFSISSLMALDQPPSFDRASQKKGPVKTWFSRDAQVRFSGCTSMNIAQPFAQQVLRKGSTALGTNQTIATSIQNGRAIMSINYKGVDENKVTIWGQEVPYFSSPAWVTYNGQL